MQQHKTMQNFFQPFLTSKWRLRKRQAWLGLAFLTMSSKDPIISQSWPCAGLQHTVKPTTPSLFAPRGAKNVISRVFTIIHHHCWKSAPSNAAGQSLSAFSKHTWPSSASKVFVCSLADVYINATLRFVSPRTLSYWMSCLAGPGNARRCSAAHGANWTFFQRFLRWCRCWCRWCMLMYVSNVVVYDIDIDDLLCLLPIVSVCWCRFPGTLVCIAWGLANSSELRKDWLIGSRLG